MTSRELIFKTLEFESPERIPRQLWFLPWAVENYPQQLERIRNDFPDDIVTAPAVYTETPKRTGNAYCIGRYIDEWGCLFENRQSGIIGEVKEPFVKTWEDLGRVRVPEEMLTVDTEMVNDFCNSTDKFVMAACCPRPFERLQFLRGTENVYMDLAIASNELQTLLNKVHRFYLRELQVWVDTDVHGLMFMDDWGAQKSLLISPAMWRYIFKPLYQEYIEIAHACGKKIFMHSDGYITDIIPDLIDLGLDALNSQLFCMGVEQLGKQFKGQITFWGEIDRQHILAQASTDDVTKAVKQVYKELYQNGGAIAQCEFGPGARPENVYTVFKTWNKF